MSLPQFGYYFLHFSTYDKPMCENDCQRNTDKTIWYYGILPLCLAVFDVAVQLHNKKKLKKYNLCENVLRGTCS